MEAALRILARPFGFSVYSEWHVDIKRPDGCWHSFTTGMPDLEAAIGSKRMSAERSPDRCFRIVKNVVLWKQI